MATITEKTQDIAGKWRVLADTGTETIMLKFDHEPTQIEVDDEVVRYTENKIAEADQDLERQIAEIERQIATLEELIT